MAGKLDLVRKALERFAVPSKGADVLGRDIPNWPGASVYHFTDRDAAAGIAESGYKTGSGYYGDMVSFTPDPTYARQFGDTATTASISDKARILNLNDEADWATYTSLVKGVPTDKIPDALRRAGYDGLYDAGAGDLFIANPSVSKFTGALDPKTGNRAFDAAINWPAARGLKEE